MTTVKCIECGYEQPEDEYSENSPCPGCVALDNYLANWGSSREAGTKDWFDFWQECEQIKGKL